MSLIYSRTKVGKRWYWIVKDGYLTEDVVAEGFCETEDECLEQALKHGEVQQCQAYFASNHRRRERAKEQLAKAQAETATGGTQVPEYVYECHWHVSDYPDGDGHSITRHRIVKKTATRLFVELDGEWVDENGIPEWQRRSLQDWEQFCIRTFILDRGEFEATGKAHRRSRYAFDCYTDFYRSIDLYLAEQQSGRRRGLPEEVRTMFELAEDATSDDLKKAYKRRIKECHPDLGGDPEEFKQIRQAYELAQGWLGC